MTRTPILSLGLLLLGSLQLSMAPAASAQSGHAHDHQAASAPQASVATQTESAATRHATDAPLRQGMADIRAAVEGLGHYEHGHMGSEQAIVLADRIQDRIGFLVANCRLAPDADQALHGVIGKLMQATAALKADPKDLRPVAHMREALADYDRLFVDPA